MRIFSLIIVLLIGSDYAFSQHSQDVLKAVFTARFIQFSQWENEEIFFQKQDKFYFYSLSEKSINNELEKTLSKIVLKGKKVEFKKISDIEEALEANVIFLSDDCIECIASLINAVENKPILIISDADNFAEFGVHINMYITNKGTIGFELNMKAFEKSGIMPNSGLIRMGKIVKQ
jgi:hypothetical protein